MAVRDTGRESFGSTLLSAPALRPASRILVPLIRGQSAGALLRLGDAVASRCAARGVVLSLVEMPPRLSTYLPTAAVRSRELLRWIASNDYTEAGDGNRLGIESRFTSDPAASIRQAVLESECDAVVAEWPHPGAQREHRLRAILRSLVADTERKLIIARPAPAGAPPRSVLAALRGGPNAWLGLSVAIAVAVHAQAQLTLLHISDLGHHPKRRSSETAAFHALAEAASDMNPQVVELTAEKPAEVLFRQGQRYDTVILGAHMSPLRPVLLLGSRLARAMDELPGTVIITRASAKTREAA